MINSLQLQYNRGRQAVITTELIDIITVSQLPLRPLLYGV
jgi:F-type H+-transporting ATPase subunit gamma